MTFKNKAAFAAIALVGALSAAPASAYMINGTTDVGSLDLVVGFAQGKELPNSSPEAETIWVNGVLGTNFAGTTNSAAIQTTQVDGNTDLYAFSLAAPAPGYFLVKNGTNWLLLQNLSSFDWGVFSIAGSFGGRDYDLNGNGDNDNPEFTISHYAKFGTATQVPEPGTLALLGLGLIGAGLSRRSRANKA